MESRLAQEEAALGLTPDIISAMGHYSLHNHSGGDSKERAMLNHYALVDNIKRARRDRQIEERTIQELQEHKQQIIDKAAPYGGDGCMICPARGKKCWSKPTEGRLCYLCMYQDGKPSYDAYSKASHQFWPSRYFDGTDAYKWDDVIRAIEEDKDLTCTDIAQIMTILQKWCYCPEWSIVEEQMNRLMVGRAFR